MSTGLIAFSLVFVGIFLYAISLYNQLVTLKHQAKKAWSNIKIALKQRNDELPKLIETCKQYMQYESTTLEKVIQARRQVIGAMQQDHLDALGAAEDRLRLGLGQLFAVAEEYPQLKSNEHFQHLQQRVTGLEENIADRREFYNESVNINNTRIEQFPDNVIAGLFRFQPFDLLQFSSQETRDVNMKPLFQKA